MSFPQFIISTGDKTAMYTLREFYEVKTAHGFFSGYSYIQNLSTNKEKAIEKAQMITGIKDIAFRAPDDLNEYQEGLAEAQRIAKEKYLADLEQSRLLKIADQKRMIDNGKYPYDGQNWNHDIKSLSISRIDYFATCEVEPDSVGEYLQQWVLKNIDNAILPRASKSTYIAAEKRRIDFEGTVTKQAHFETYDFRGRPCVKFVHTIITTEGYCLVTFSDAFYEDVGTKVTGKCTVKTNDIREDIYQSVVQRIKLK